MTIRRRNLRKGLIALGFLVAEIAFPGAMLGGVLILVGSALHVWSKGCLEQNRRLTTAGPYRWTRNPFYLANLLIDLGLCFIIGRWWVALPYLAIWAYSYRQTISREEAVLASLFPEAFGDYVKAVPVLIPTGRGLPKEKVCGRFSLDNDALARGREYARLLGIALAPGVIWAGEVLRRERLGILDDAHAFELEIMVILLAAWIVKLALAETFAHPESALLPFASRPDLRRIVTVALVAGLFYGTECQTTWTGIGLSGAILFGLVVYPRDETPSRRKQLFWIGGASLSLALGFANGLAWLAGPSTVWCLLSALDQRAASHAIGGTGDTGETTETDEAGETETTTAVALEERPLWNRFLPIAGVLLLTVAGLEIVHRVGL